MDIIVKNSAIKDMSGLRIGRLTVVEFSHIEYRNAFWKCKCDCGNNKIICGTSLRRTKRPTNSCGCIQRENVSKQHAWNRKSPGEASAYALYLTYQKSAKTRKIPFELSVCDFKQITKENCFYCGISPAQSFHVKSTHHSYIYNGIDRSDNSKGYTLDNSLACCKKCNYAKHVNSSSEFLEWAERLSNHLLSTGDITLTEEVYSKLEKLT